MKNNCIEFKVKLDESAHFNIQNYNFQDNIRYSIDIFETIKPANFICAFYSFTKIPKKYFGNADTEPKRYIDKREPARWKVIQKLMIDNNIKEVTIRLCPFEKNGPNKKIYESITLPFTSSEKPAETNDISNTLRVLPIPENKKKTLNNHLLILPCTSEKVFGGVKLKNPNNNFSTNQNILKCRENRFNFYKEELLKEDVKKYFNKKRQINFNKVIKVNNKYFKKCIDEPYYMMAIDRYDGILYTKKVKELVKEKIKEGLHVLIISGLYGILKYDDHIIDYQLEIKTGGFNVWKKNNINCISDILEKYISDNKIKHENITVILSGEYMKAFEKSKKFEKNIWDCAEGYGHNHVSYLLKYLTNL